MKRSALAAVLSAACFDAESGTRDDAVTGRAPADAGRGADVAPDACQERQERPCECAVPADGAPGVPLLPDAGSTTACDGGVRCPWGKPFIGDPCGEPQVRLAEYRPIEDQVRVLGDGDEVELVCCGAKGYYLPVVVMAINVCAGDALMHIVYPKDTIDGSFHGPHDVKRMVMLPPSERSGAWAVPVRVSEPHEPAYERESVCWVDDNAVMPDRALMLEYGMEDVAGRSAWGTMRIVPVCRGVHMAECGGRPCVTRSERYREHCECLCGRPIEPPVSETCPPPEGGCGG